MQQQTVLTRSKTRPCLVISSELNEDRYSSEETQSPQQGQEESGDEGSTERDCLISMAMGQQQQGVMSVDRGVMKEIMLDDSVDFFKDQLNSCTTLQECRFDCLLVLILADLQ